MAQIPHYALVCNLTQLRMAEHCLGNCIISADDPLFNRHNRALGEVRRLVDKLYQRVEFAQSGRTKRVRKRKEKGKTDG